MSSEISSVLLLTLVINQLIIYLNVMCQQVTKTGALSPNYESWL